MIEATDINYLRTSTINIAASENTPSIINIIDDDIDSTITKTPQNQYCLVEKLTNSTNANVEVGPSCNNKKYHTTVKDYVENNNDGDNEKGTDLSYNKDLQDIEEQEELQPRKRKRPLKKLQKKIKSKLKKVDNNYLAKYDRYKNNIHFNISYVFIN
ncbi:14861_t:CDS:2 [Gigaspora margarita]|uniref:14861_t:CDS:1 n=1 Tax=Gigaspora margarita TaxID=4874 RepID=A0ABN7UE65_GIGMA|nr:14861_t:CDS:2 [Gigaspora margarita]